MTIFINQKTFSAKSKSIPNPPGKGFGFIECAETFAVFNQDVFLHKKEMPSVEHVGAEVQFQIMLNNKGQPQATEVQVIGQGVQDGLEGGDPNAAAAGGFGGADAAANGGYAQDFNALAGGANVFDAGAAGNGAGGYEHAEGADGEEPAAKRIKV